MSGYCTNCGVFELTPTKMKSWLRRQELPTNCVCECCGQIKDSFRDVVIACLEEDKLAVINKDKDVSWVAVKGTPAEVWTALSRQPSDPQMADNFIRTATQHCAYCDHL